MILILAVLLGVTPLALSLSSLPSHYCTDTTSLNLVYRLNEQEPYESISDFLTRLNIETSDSINKDGLLFQLNYMCRQKNLTLAWLRQQAESNCPNLDEVRNLLQHNGAVCDENGNVSTATRNALSSFVRINTSVECTFAYSDIYTECDINTMFSDNGPTYPEMTLARDSAESSRRKTAAIRCAIPQVVRLAPGCGSLADLKIYSLISELIQLQPIKLNGELGFDDFSNVMA
ncbi:uncharacterized protein [Argopecten irradians]|uniref:uncharacterized protein n=1 Tax=Argopecten irradians TaxID=31199 RepID=UPI003716B644